MLCFCINLSPHSLHEKGFTSRCPLMWFLKSSSLAHFSWQVLYSNDHLFFSWTSNTCLASVLVLNMEAQWGHFTLPSSVCLTTMCCFRPVLVLKSAGQRSHLCGLEPIWSRSVCSLNSEGNKNPFSQTLQKYLCFFRWMALMWIPRAVFVEIFLPQCGQAPEAALPSWIFKI